VEPRDLFDQIQSATGEGLGMAGARQASPGLIIAICFGIAALEGYDIQAFGVAAPHMAPDLKLGPAELGWAGSAAMIGLVIGALFGGWAADRHGRRPVLLGSVALFGVFSLATALAINFETLTLARLATGLGFGGAMPNLIAIATEISPPNRRALTTTSMFCGLPVGGALVALAAQVGDQVDWRMLFMIGGALPLMLVPVVYFLLPETRPARSDARAPPQMLSGLFADGRAFATLMIWTVFALDLLVTYLLLNWLPLLVVAKGFTAAQGASAAFAMNIMAVVGSLVLGWGADKVGYRWLLIAVFGGLAAALYALAAADGMPMILAASGAAGFTVIGGLYVLYALAPIYYPPQFRAAGAGASVAAGRLGSIVGPLVAGQLRAVGYGPGEVLSALAPVAVVTMAAVFMLTTYGKPYRED
jgi:AAHS family 3-hydroxyphenylpropionic acid transporter